jgi:hypothetical protein
MVRAVVRGRKGTTMSRITRTRSRTAGQGGTNFGRHKHTPSKPKFAMPRSFPLDDNRNVTNHQNTNAVYSEVMSPFFGCFADFDRRIDGFVIDILN